MATLTYLTNVSLDGYIEDADGGLDWTSTDGDVFEYLTDASRAFGTNLYGRRLYEMMAQWETDPALAAGGEAHAEFARIWSRAQKVVYSTTLEEPLTANTRVEGSFDPDAVRALKEAATEGLIIGGADIAAQAFAAGLVDELHLVIHPAVLRAGKPALPGVHADLELIEERRFDGGAVAVRYRVA